MKKIFDSFFEIAKPNTKKALEKILECHETHTSSELSLIVRDFINLGAKKDWNTSKFIINDNGFNVSFHEYRPHIEISMSTSLENHDIFTTSFVFYLNQINNPYSIKFELNSSVQEGDLCAEYDYKDNPDSDFFSDINFDNDQNNFNYYSTNFKSYMPHHDKENLYVFSEKQIILLFLNNYLNISEKKQEISDILLLNYDIQLEKDELLNPVFINALKFNELINKKNIKVKNERYI